VSATDLVVPPEQRGQRLDRFLTSFLGGHSRSQLQKLIADGLVTVDGRTAKANLTLRDGDRVRIELPDPVPSEVASEALPLDILYQDDDLAVVNKPAGMVVHPAAGHASGTLVNALLHHLSGLSGIGGELRPGIVHRLDRGTSGVMVVAKHDAAHQELSRQFHDREVEKEYIALVWGVVQAGRRIDAAIGRDPSDRQKMSSRAKYAREAVTRITRALHLPGLTLCQVAIHTGRTHQIRVHLAHLGYPIAGDDKYGDFELNRRVARGEGASRLGRMFLHACATSFSHPVGGQPIALEAPLPDDCASFLKGLHAAPV
jgi:23S rRNA pseudouridine1911/1915/1917 synthase